ncbi:transposon Ty3-I Gag-Pol polyprotein [Trichonephila clavata]|uniref:Transposon Ty3-I Gag-Pol polyprotein n=1 Tax=Trichonephila clavata TaxID=2740835 RepID=A0A8X6LGE1_TRICU|nr:transposon Ty3-I Gag-Pol polyprotein [Trichonephila clavata]
MLPFDSNDVDGDYISKIIARDEESRQLTRVRTLKAQDKDRRRYDSKYRMVSYAPGDLVWVYTLVRKVGCSEKLLRRPVRCKILILSPEEENRKKLSMHCV